MLSLIVPGDIVKYRGIACYTGESYTLHAPPLLSTPPIQPLQKNQASVSSSFFSDTGFGRPLVNCQTM